MGMRSIHLISGNPLNIQSAHTCQKAATIPFPSWAMFFGNMPQFKAKGFDTVQTKSQRNTYKDIGVQAKVRNHV